MLRLKLITLLAFGAVAMVSANQPNQAQFDDDDYYLDDEAALPPPRKQKQKTNFNCPEKNGKFPDPEQCDLYYVCENGIVREEICPDGEVFDISRRNKERCVLPHGIDCGDRIYVQDPTPGIDPKCARANGIFDHDDPNVCDKFYLCDKGTAHEMPCVGGLVFDSEIGSCVRKGQLTPGGKQCKTDEKSKCIGDFCCPGNERIGPQGLLQTHPIFPHPSDCQFFFTCYFGKDPHKFGCPKGQVFDEASQVCHEPADVPECGCWYECPEDSKCPDSCNADCSCPNPGQEGGYDEEK